MSIRGAMERGHLEVAKYLKREGCACPWPQEAVTDAARSGHIHLLKWFRSEGFVFDEKTCAAAASRPDLSTLIWLRIQDPPCPWDGSTWIGAIQAGNLPTLKYLKRGGCPWTPKGFACAADCGQVALLQWLSDEGMETMDLAASHFAAKGGHLNTLKWFA